MPLVFHTLKEGGMEDPREGAVDGSAQCPCYRRSSSEVSSEGRTDRAWTPLPHQVLDRWAGSCPCRAHQPHVLSQHWWLVILASHAEVPALE